MNYSISLDLLVLSGAYVLTTLLLLWTLVRTLGRQFQQVSEARYDYKVVDLIVLQDPDNHEKQVQKWADEGWSIVACVPLVGGATEGAPEVRYILSKPWKSQRLVRALKAETKQPQEGLEQSKPVQKEKE